MLSFHGFSKKECDPWEVSLCQQRYLEEWEQATTSAVEAERKSGQTQECRSCWTISLMSKDYINTHLFISLVFPQNEQSGNNSAAGELLQ